MRAGSRVFLAVLLWGYVGATGLVRAGWEEALLAEATGNYKAAFSVYLPLAQRGEAWPQYRLGVMYDQGRGVEEDQVAAAHWFRLAAEQGLVQAQSNLGMFYATGRGVQQDWSEAVDWLTRAALQGDQWAQADLGQIHLDGRGVVPDRVRAFAWLVLAAEQGEEPLGDPSESLRPGMSEADIRAALKLIESLKRRIADRAAEKISVGEGTSGVIPGLR